VASRHSIASCATLVSELCKRRSARCDVQISCKHHLIFVCRHSFSGTEHAARQPRGICPFSLWRYSVQFFSGAWRASRQLARAQGASRGTKSARFSDAAGTRCGYSPAQRDIVTNAARLTSPPDCCACLNFQSFRQDSCCECEMFAILSRSRSQPPAAPRTEHAIFWGTGGKGKAVWGLKPQPPPAPYRVGCKLEVKQAAISESACACAHAEDLSCLPAAGSCRVVGPCQRRFLWKRGGQPQ